ncbi:cyclic 2,3-diphosphoglycerate synthase [Limnochorda pilosa]
MGAAGRDFHNFNVRYREDPGVRVVAFTATQIPHIEGRVYPRELAGPLYPQGVPIVPEAELAGLIRRESVDDVVFAYSDVPHVYVMHKASEVLAAGATFLLLGPRDTWLKAKVPVVSVTAVRTGSGKSQTTRALAQALTRWGRRVAVVRHPMPYGDLAAQAVQRFAAYEDLDRHRCTIEEREEYEPHIDRGNVVYAGVDYGRILEQAQAEADVVLWDGGNNDLPFYRPDLAVVVADPHRPGHEASYHPGEANARLADVIVINKVDTADPEQVAEVRRNLAFLNPGARVIEAGSPIRLENGADLAGKRVLVVEDGPTLTHGGMSYGAGVLAARRAGAVLVDPRPHAVGSLQETFSRFPQLGELLPAMGYGEEQVAELGETIRRAPVDAVVIGTPIDLRRVVPIDKPTVRAYYDLDASSAAALEDVLRERLPGLAPS